ncbi:Histone-lysine n-methyltransferase [Thalictrum thalictroides]|uniref:Histone-lysine n-methyltransferase n=1 Tax=Thalictrum thalictroides TaxID=46969 RepID=A0A7J6V5J1_THATH|nr:Histone-lysine n-methyltransferase [Thalictrum thalictroides]
MAFHVACPITCQRICFCKLGFPQKIQSDKAKKNFLEEVYRVEEFLNDPWSIRAKESTNTVQVVVPKVVPPPPPPIPVVTATAIAAVDGFGIGDSYGGGGVGGGDGEELMLLHSKRTALQKRAVAASIAAEDYARKFEAGALALVDNAGETVDIVRDDMGVKVMCRICFDGENEGSEKASRMLVCRRTTDPTKFMFCKRCDGAYHCHCLQPPHKNVSTGPYLCPKHTRCHSCGSNVPGNGPSTRWFLGYTCCDACGRLFVKGNYCPVCLKVYRDSESTPMVCCDVCQRWVHCHCDGISDEKYLQFQADGNLYYKCTACRGECYQVTGLDDAVQELWRRRDKADLDQIASLRASAGLPSEEAFSFPIYSDDEDYNPIVLKNEYGRSLKISVKGSVNKGTKNTKEYGKKLSIKKYGKKKGHQVSLMGKSDAHPIYEGLHDRKSIEFTLSDEKNDDVPLYRSDEIHMLSSSSVRSPSNRREKCSINQAGIMKHNFVDEVVANNEDRAPKVAQTKGSKSHGPFLGFGFGKQTSKLENVKGKKLVIHLGARNRNVNNSPRSEASSCHREQEIPAFNGIEDESHQKVNKKFAVERDDGAARISDVKGEKPLRTEQLKYSRAQEGSLLKLGKVKSEVSDINSQSGKGNIPDGSTIPGKTRASFGRSKEGSAATPECVTGAPALRTEAVPLRRHSKGTPDMPKESLDNSRRKVSTLDSLPKDPKPLLKLKFKNPYLDNRSSWVSQEEEKSLVKGQRSKRKRPEKNEVREEEGEEEEGEEGEEVEEEEANIQVNQDSPVKEVMDANWILKKLGKDAIGKRVEVQQQPSSSWHKGEVTEMIEGSSTVVVRLDDGRTRALELGKQAIRFVSQKQKRSKV